MQLLVIILNKLCHFVLLLGSLASFTALITVFIVAGGGAALPCFVFISSSRHQAAALAVLLSVKLKSLFEDLFLLVVSLVVFIFIAAAQIAELRLPLCIRLPILVDILLLGGIHLLLSLIFKLL